MSDTEQPKRETPFHGLEQLITIKCPIELMHTLQEEEEVVELSPKIKHRPTITPSSMNSLATPWMDAFPMIPSCLPFLFHEEDEAVLVTPSGDYIPFLVEAKKDVFVMENATPRELEALPSLLSSQGLIDSRTNLFEGEEDDVIPSTDSCPHDLSEDSIPKDKPNLHDKGEPILGQATKDDVRGAMKTRQGAIPYLGRITRALAKSILDKIKEELMAHKFPMANDGEGWSVLVTIGSTSAKT